MAYAIDHGIALLVAPYELTPLEVRLMTICRHRGECTATQLVQMMPVDAARISRLVNTLVEKGLLGRRRQRNDRRVVMLRLTPQGEAVIDEIAASLRECFAELTEGLSEQEIRAFVVAVQRIVANYDEISGTLQAVPPPDARGGGQ